MNTKDILNALPNSWDEITLGQFQRLTKPQIIENNDSGDGVQKSIAVIAKLVGKSEDEIGSLPMKDLWVLGQKISFMIEPPPPSTKTNIKWKKLEEITYNDFVRCANFQDNELEKLHEFIKQFSKTDLTESQILALPITEVMNGFFLFRNQLRKYLKRSIRLTKMQLLIHQIKAKFKTITKK